MHDGNKKHILTKELGITHMKQLETSKKQEDVRTEIMTVYTQLKKQDIGDTDNR